MNNSSGGVVVPVTVGPPVQVSNIYLVRPFRHNFAKDINMFLLSQNREHFKNNYKKPKTKPNNDNKETGQSALPPTIILAGGSSPPLPPDHPKTPSLYQQ